ncbi:MAG: DNA-binding protein HU [Rickettsiales bacterium]|jgi:DNA-binding protein HU-beta|nr:DNA-binding protein HU [Rickettsiales bacterium]OUT44142.1 MAG: DNA-binding protein HU [Pelagibacteraceae bacterium TMED13]|tara:strand:+ start:19 stop:291 length:273 start_codon:yes stop_codon:yes gene_type:complete
MNKNDLVSKVSEDTGLSKSDSAKAVDSVIETITSELKSGGDVRLVGFGTFLVTKRKATTGRNPQTGAEIKIPAANVPKFRAGKSLKESLN